MNRSQALSFIPGFSHSQASALSPATLAYLGDAVYELFVRSQQLLPARKIHDYHQSVVAQVKAEAQASLAQRIHPFLNDVEKDIFRRARNAAEGKPRRLNLVIYQQATGLEAVLGYLYLTNSQRLMEILGHCESPAFPS